MKRLSTTEIAMLIERISDSSADGDTPAWQALHIELSARPAVLTMPIGEFCNPSVSGFWYGHRGPFAWRTDDSAGVEKHGIEGITDISLPLMDALLFADAAGHLHVSIQA